MKKLFFLSFFFLVALINAQSPVITKWNTNINNDNSKEINIYITGSSYTYTYVKADDPSVTGSGNGNDGMTTITFPQVGEYVVSIYPSAFFTFTFRFGLGSLGNNKKLAELSQWGDVSWNNDLSNMFTNCSNLQITATDIPNFPNVINMRYMFRGCSSLTTIPNMNSWNISNVTDMYYMFYGATNFNQNIGNWDTSKVTQMSFMFYGATNFNQNIGNWDISKVIYMDRMFSDAWAFNQNLGNWQLNSAVYLTNMFDNSGMNCENYSKTLYGWAENSTTPNNKNLGAVGMKYGVSAQVYRNKLINDKSWTISGDSFDSGCDVTLSMADIHKKEIVLYPNPVKDILNFSEDVFNVRIADISGKMLKQFSVSGKTVDVSKLAKGIYMVTVVAKSGKTVTKKIVKE
ncbi:MAG: BspA family leucine-rich repeat surface protein [Bergeyella sp.]